MPARQKVYEWLDADPEFSGQHARAEKRAASAIVDSMERVESRVLDGDLDPNAARTVLWSRQWRASKADSSRFGDRQVLAGDPEAPLQVQHKPDFSGLSKAERDAVRAILEAHPPVAKESGK